MSPQDNTCKLIDWSPGRPRSTALERQDLSCTYLAHHELESDFNNVVVIIIIIIIVVG